MISSKATWWDACLFIIFFTSVTPKSLSTARGTVNDELTGNDVKEDNLKNSCDNEWTTIHGSIEKTDMREVTCPRDGIVDEIVYWSKVHEEGPRIHAIALNCNSSLGVTSWGPFGTKTGKKRVLKCKNSNDHIKYLRGRAGEYISRLEIVCSERSGLYDNEEINEEDLQNVDQDELMKQEMVTNGKNQKIDPIKNFNDECHSTKGRRPVSFIIFTGKFFQGLRTSYKDVPVAKDCKISHIQFLEKEKIVKVDNLVVLGFTSGFTCSASQQEISLDITNNLSESQEKEKEESYEGKLVLTAPSTTTQTGIVLFGVGTLDLLSSRKFLIPLLTTRYSSSNTSGSIYQTNLGTTIKYQGPGMSLVIGYKITYIIENKKIPVIYHYTCAGGGSRTYEEGNIDLNSSKLESIFFLDYHYKFNNVDDCLKSSYPQECVASIQIKNFITDPEQIEKEFYKCFDTEAIPFHK